MDSKLRVITMLMGGLFTLQGVEWIVAPELAAEGLGMPALEGLARSTQFGDFAAFFLVLGLSILAGTRPGQNRVLYFPAAMLGGAAICRTLAWALHGAEFATLFITIEVITCMWCLASARIPTAAA